MGLGNPDRPVGGLAVRLPPGIELEPLGRDDLAPALALARGGRSLPPAQPSAEMAARFEGLIGSVDSVAYVARRGPAAVGLAIMQLRRRLNYATFEGWIGELHVADDPTAEATGRALVQALVAEWQLRGGHRVQASAEAGGSQLAGALQEAGFEEGSLDFRLRPLPVLDQGAMPERTTLREIRPEDADAVTRLIAEFGPRRSPVPDRMEAVLRTYAAHVRDVASGRAASRAAELDGVVVGVLTLEWRRPFWTEDLHAWIPDLVVTEPFRGRGIGRALLADALGRARAAGATEVRLESGEQRTAAHALYRSAGFEVIGRTWMLRRDPG